MHRLKCLKGLIIPLILSVFPVFSLDGQINSPEIPSRSCGLAYMPIKEFPNLCYINKCESGMG